MGSEVVQSSVHTSALYRHIPVALQTYNRHSSFVSSARQKLVRNCAIEQCAVGPVDASRSGLYIANFEYRDSRLICKIFGGQRPALSPFLEVERKKSD
jgi:hypothetical protein